MKHVLVTAIGSFSADIVIKKLRSNNFYIVGCDIYNKEWIVDAYNVDAFYRAPYAVDTIKYLAFIKEICIQEKIDYIIPLTDIEVDIFNSNRAYFKDCNITICISSKSAIDLCRNKNSLTDYINSHSLCKTITTEPLNSFKNSDSDFPLVCKPYDGRSSQGLRYIKSQSELDAFIVETTSDNSISKYIVQPFIKGSIITVDVIKQPGKKSQIAVSRKELLRTLNGAGTSIYIFNDENLNLISLKLADAIGIRGCVNFEFIADDSGDYCFLECNPRFSGGVEFSCIAGYDYISNHMRCFTDDDIDTNPIIHNQYIARKFEEYVTKIEN